MKNPYSIFILVLGIAASLIGCSKTNSNTAITGKGPTDGKVISPREINLRDYPNVRGTLLGIWDGQKRITNENTGLVGNVTYRLYVGANSTILRLICEVRRNPVIDVTISTSSALDEQNLSIFQNLGFNLESCGGTVFSLPAGAVPYHFVRGNPDSVVFGSPQNPMLLIRTRDAGGGRNVEDPRWPNQPNPLPNPLPPNPPRY